MTLLRSLDDARRFRGGVVSIGNFDGVHRGHAHLVRRLRLLALQRQAPAVVLTFDPHPNRILRPEQVIAPLTTLAERVRLLAESGADVVVAHPPSRSFLNLTPAAFFRDVIVGQLGALGLVEGPSFCFGRGRTGDLALLGTLAREAGIELEVVAPCECGGEVVSSSRIREHLAAGRVVEAADGLGRPYQIAGVVQHGAGRGKELGFPTVNVGEIETLVPGNGVYAGRACLDGATWPAALSVGAAATFGETENRVEAHLVGYQGDAYGHPVKLEFLRWLRPMQRFEGVDQLRQQLARDVAETAVSTL